MAIVTEEIMFDVNMTAEDVKTKLKLLSGEITKVENKYKNIFNRTDTSNIDEAVHKLELLKNLVESADKVRLTSGFLNVQEIQSGFNTINAQFENLEKFVSQSARKEMRDINSIMQLYTTQLSTYNTQFKTGIATNDKALMESASRGINNIQKEVAVFNQLLGVLQQTGLLTDEFKAKVERLYTTTGKVSLNINTTNLSNASKSIKELEQETEILKEKYRVMFKSGDRSGLEGLNTEFTNLRNKAEAIKQEVQNIGSTGINIEPAMNDLTLLEQRFNRLAESNAQSLTSGISSSSSGMKKSLTEVGTQLSNALIKGFKTGFNVGKKLLDTWIGYWKTSITKTGDVLRSVFNGVFSSKNTGMSQVISQIKSFTAMYTSLYAIVRLMKESVTLGASIFEIQNVTDTVFKSASEEIDNFCENAISKFGLTQLEAKEMIGVFGGMLGASEITGKAQVEMSKNLTALAGDIASFYNIKTSEAYEKLQSGLAGMVQPLRAFGINMTVANLEAYALSKGITASFDSLDQATKTTLRYNYILEKMTDTQGDFTKTNKSWANQVRLLSSNFKVLLSILGSGLIKVLYPTLQMLNAIVQSSIYVAEAMSHMFDFDSDALDDLFGKGAVQSTDYLGEMLDDTTESVEDYSDAIKKANNNLQGFDELNNMVSKTLSSGNGLDSSLNNSSESLISFDSYYEKVKSSNSAIEKDTKEKLNNILSSFQYFFREIGKIDKTPLQNSISDMKSELSGVLSSVTGVTDDLGSEIVLPAITWTVEEGIPATLDLISAALSALKSTVDVCREPIKSFYNKSLKPYINIKAGNFTATLESWTAAIKQWNEDLKNAEDPQKFLKDTVADVQLKVEANLDEAGIKVQYDTIKKNLAGIFDNVISGEAETSMANYASSIVLIGATNLAGITGLLNTILNPEVSSGVKGLAEKFSELSGFTFDKLESVLGKILASEDTQDIAEHLKNSIENIEIWLDNNIDTILEDINKITSAIEDISTVLAADEDGTVWSALKAVVAFSFAAPIISQINSIVAAIGVSGAGAAAGTGLLGAIGLIAPAVAIAVGAIAGLDAIKDTAADVVANKAQEEYLKYTELSEEIAADASKYLSGEKSTAVRAYLTKGEQEAGSYVSDFESWYGRLLEIKQFYDTGLEVEETQIRAIKSLVAAGGYFQEGFDLTKGEYDFAVKSVPKKTALYTLQQWREMLDEVDYQDEEFLAELDAYIEKLGSIGTVPLLAPIDAEIAANLAHFLGDPYKELTSELAMLDELEDKDLYDVIKKIISMDKGVTKFTTDTPLGSFLNFNPADAYNQAKEVGEQYVKGLNDGVLELKTGQEIADTLKDSLYLTESAGTYGTDVAKAYVAPMPTEIVNFLQKSFGDEQGEDIANALAVKNAAKLAGEWTGQQFGEGIAAKFEDGNYLITSPTGKSLDTLVKEALKKNAAQSDGGASIAGGVVAKQFSYGIGDKFVELAASDNTIVSSGATFFKESVEKALKNNSKTGATEAGKAAGSAFAGAIAGGLVDEKGENTTATKAISNKLNSIFGLTAVVEGSTTLEAKVQKYGKDTGVTYGSSIKDGVSIPETDARGTDTSISGKIDRAIGGKAEAFQGDIIAYGRKSGENYAGSLKEKATDMINDNARGTDTSISGKIDRTVGGEAKEFQEDVKYYGTITGYNWSQAVLEAMQENAENFDKITITVNPATAGKPPRKNQPHPPAKTAVYDIARGEETNERTYKSLEEIDAELKNTNDTLKDVLPDIEINEDTITYINKITDSIDTFYSGVSSKLTDLHTTVRVAKNLLNGISTAIADDTRYEAIKAQNEITNQTLISILGAYQTAADNDVNVSLTCDLTLDGRNMAQFVIDTMDNQAKQTNTY